MPGETGSRLLRTYPFDPSVDSVAIILKEGSEGSEEGSGGSMAGEFRRGAYKCK